MEAPDSGLTYPREVLHPQILLSWTGSVHAVEHRSYIIRNSYSEEQAKGARVGSGK